MIVEYHLKKGYEPSDNGAMDIGIGKKSKETQDYRKKEKKKEQNSDLRKCWKSKTKII